MGSSSSTDKLIKQVLELVKKQNDILTKIYDKIFSQPPPPPPPPPVDHGCLPTQVWDEAQQKCVERPVPNICPAGQHWDEAQQKCVDNSIPPPGPPKPTEGQVKTGGNQDPATWHIVNMTNNPALFKVVDDKGKNIATDFTTAVTAQGYIDYYVWVKGTPPPPPPPPPPPVDHGCTATQHWDEATQKCIDNPPPPVGGVDLEGIQMLYADDRSKAAQQFFLSREGPNHARVDGKGARKVNADGTVSITPDPGTNPASARIYIFTTTSDHSIEKQLILGKDWNKMASMPDIDGINRGGWMVTNQDYRDVEATQYYKIPTIKTDDEMTMYLGGHHPSGGFPDQCVSSCYKAQIQTKDCTTRSAIEWDHYNSPSNYAWWDGKQDKVDLKSELGGSMAGKIIGQKYVRYNEIGSDGKVKAVHMELYVDTASKDLPKPDLTKQNWRLMNEWVHDGTNWPTKPADNARESGCNAAGIKMPAFGSDSVSIRFDESPWTLYNLSVRPIVPVKGTNPPPPPPPDNSVIDNDGVEIKGKKKQTAGTGI